MNNLNNIQNLDSIIFFTGEYSTVAAQNLENRNYDASVEGYGTLQKDNNSYSYYTNYPNVKYVERNVVFENMNDLYLETYSYVSKVNSDFPIGYTYISKNRYNAIYTYETDLDNDLDNAEIFIPRDLDNFLKGLNEQVYNKQLKYGNDIEVSSIKIDQTYYTWFPKDTIAYYNVYKTETPIEIIEYSYNDNSVNAFTDWDSVEMTEELIAIKQYAEENNLYVHQHITTEIKTEYTYTPYIIGGDYYSYVQKSYDIIRPTLIDKVKNSINTFKDKYNNDASIYAYYMYDCNSDIEMLLTTKSLGIKQSTFKISFDSEFNNWFGNTLNIKANLSENDPIVNITSFKDNEIFSIFKNKINRLTGDNKVINKDNTYTFTANLECNIDNDIINILPPYSIDTLDLSQIKTKMSNILNLNETNWILRDCNLKSLILDDGDNSTKSNLEKIYGLNDITTLEYINIANVDKLNRTPAIDKLTNLKVFNASNSNIDSFRPARGTTLYHVDLPDTVKSIKLVDNTFERGSLKIAGREVEFDGKLNYTPNTNLINLTVRNIDNELSYNLITNWYDVLDTENKLDNSLIYLEMKNINWNKISAQTLINLKKFDMDPNLISGTISIVGSGNYGFLTRNEYQNITKLYGVNAFVNTAINNDNITNKVFKYLNINTDRDVETFEYKLTLQNDTLLAKNEAITNNNEVRFIDTLDVEFKGYQYNLQNQESVSEKPYINRAANSLLDMIYNDGITEFRFIKDYIEDENGKDISEYVYCDLERSIDTSSSNEVKNIKAGDILLFNGNTLVIFFKDVENTIYEYIKLGSIVDQKVQNYVGTYLSSIANWFNGNDEEYVLRFNPSNRKPVIQKLTLSFISEDENVIYETNENGIQLAINIDDYAKEHFDEIENKKIHIVYDENILDIEEVEQDQYYKLFIIKPKNTITELINTNVSIYCDANERDTKETVKITLRKKFEYSTYDESEYTIILDSDGYSYDEETQSIIANNSLVNTEYDETDNILTID